MVYYLVEEKLMTMHIVLKLFLEIFFENIIK